MLLFLTFCLGGAIGALVFWLESLQDEGSKT